MEQLANYLRVCEEAARAGGAVIQDWRGRAEVHHKGPADLVTDADFAAQETVRKLVLGAFPDHGFLGEEKQPATTSPKADYRWIVDPLDGTTNFVHGVPHYACSVGLERCGHRGQPIVGAIYDPSTNECFTAAQGHGAFLNGKRLSTSRVEKLDGALACSSFPAQVKNDSPDLLVFNKSIFQCQGVRRTGSAALNLSYLAAGRFDVLWGFSTKPWDIAAGVIIVREAGGVVSSPEGGELDLDSGRFLAAANPGLYLHLREMVREAVGV
jgi:myo-inositol-1(or 4)-monophosphatase